MPLLGDDDLPEGLRVPTTKRSRCPFCAVELPAANLALCPGCVKMLGLRCGGCGAVSPLEAVTCESCGDRLQGERDPSPSPGEVIVAAGNAAGRAAVRANRRDFLAVALPTVGSFAALSVGVVEHAFSPWVAAVIAGAVVIVARDPARASRRALRLDPNHQVIERAERAERERRTAELRRRDAQRKRAVEAARAARAARGPTGRPRATRPRT